jgi:1-deoxy-D-xylulose-5-phosphate reductoisomerase
MQGRGPGEVERLIITATGGPFRTRNDLSGVTPEDALAHPTWSMGPKITVDSATMMNKALELIEAHHLFGFDYEHMDVVVHPQSVVHAGAELADGSLVLQAAHPDMRIPIAAALSYPERLGPPPATVDLADVGSLTFEPVDEQRFPAVGLGYEIGRRAGTYPAVFNAANEVAVAAFLDERIGFTDIVRVVADAIERHEGGSGSDLDGVLAADSEGREVARELVGAVATGSSA